MVAYSAGSIFSMQSPQRMFTVFVALTLWWQQGQTYLRVLLGFLVLVAVPLSVPLGSVPTTSHRLTASHIESAAGLCYECLNDIALDVFGMTRNDHDFEDADPLELAEIKRRWKPYIGQLPEYAYLCDELLSRSK